MTRQSKRKLATHFVSQSEVDVVQASSESKSLHALHSKVCFGASLENPLLSEHVISRECRTPGYVALMTDEQRRLRQMQERLFARWGNSQEWKYCC